MEPEAKPAGDMSDEQLLRRFAAGDRHALGTLASRYETSLLGLSCGMLGGRRDLAADAVQETWMRVIRYATSFNGHSSVKTWLYRIAVNQCRNLRAARPAALVDDEGANRDLIATPTRSASPHAEALRDVIERLSDDQRSILLLCYHSGLTHEHVAQVLEIPLGTVKSRLHAALTRLRELLAQEGNER